MARWRRILVPVDFSESSDLALHTAESWALAFGARIDLLHVVPLNGLGADEAQAALERAASAAHADVIHSRSVVKALAPELAIIEAARKAPADLIVMGTHGRSGWSHVKLGSVAERVVSLAPCAVLTVRRPGQTFIRP